MSARPHPSDPTKGMWGKLFGPAPMARKKLPLFWHLNQIALASIPPILAWLWMLSLDAELDEMREHKREWYEAEENRLRHQHQSQAGFFTSQIDRLDQRLSRLEENQAIESSSTLPNSTTTATTSSSSSFIDEQSIVSPDGYTPPNGMTAEQAANVFGPALPLSAKRRLREAEERMLRDYANHKKEK